MNFIRKSSVLLLLFFYACSSIKIEEKSNALNQDNTKLNYSVKLIDSLHQTNQLKLLEYKDLTAWGGLSISFIDSNLVFVEQNVCNEFGNIIINHYVENNKVYYISDSTFFDAKEEKLMLIFINKNLNMFN